MSTLYHNVDKGSTQWDCWTPFLRQLHISSGVWTLYFMNGLCVGAPTVIVPQIRRDWNSTATIDDELASWLYSASNFAAMPWVFFLPVLSQFIGRRIPYLTCCIAMSVVFTLLYFSSAPNHILIAETIQGICNAIAVTILIHTIPEYCNHRCRNLYLNIQCTTFYWGLWVSNAIGTFFHWKYITVLGLICTLYSFTLSFYPESPRWLASKGKFTECEAAYRWMQGSGPEAEKELKDLIKSLADYSQKENKITFSKFRKMLTCKQFYLPLFLVFLIGAQYNLSGKFVCSIYAIEMFKKITTNENAAYTGMLILDGVTVMGMYFGSFISKFLKLRSLYFGLSFLSIVVMLSFSLYLYLANLGIIPQKNIVTLGFLVVYSLAISTGPIVLSLNFYTGVVAIQYQAITYANASLIFITCSTIMLKFSPLLFTQLGIHGTFLFFGISCAIITTLLYIYLPETQNKTLQQIEEYFKDSERTPETEKLTKGVEDGVRN